MSTNYALIRNSTKSIRRHSSDIQRVSLLLKRKNCVNRLDRESALNNSIKKITEQVDLIKKEMEKCQMRKIKSIKIPTALAYLKAGKKLVLNGHVCIRIALRKDGDLWQRWAHRGKWSKFGSMAKFRDALKKKNFGKVKFYTEKEWDK